jgi:sulfonate transport system permease protein
MTFVLPDPRLAASRRAQLAYARISRALAQFACSSRWLISCIVPAAALTVWWIASPAPHVALRALADASNAGELQRPVALTLCWLLAGYALGVGSGILLGVGLGLSRRAELLLYPTLKALAHVPLLGWLLVWLVLLGPGDMLKVVLVAQASLTPVLGHVFAGIRGVPPALLEVGHVLRLRRGQLLRRIVMPAALPSIARGVRRGMTKGWLALLALEIFLNAQSLYRLDLMFVVVISVGIMGYALERTLATTERRVLRLP